MLLLLLLLVSHPAALAQSLLLLLRGSSRVKVLFCGSIQSSIKVHISIQLHTWTI
jgi:hypothetical protein